MQVHALSKCHNIINHHHLKKNILPSQLEKTQLYKDFLWVSVHYLLLQKAAFLLRVKWCSDLGV